MSDSNPFEALFRDPVYLDLKNHLYNYQRRRNEVLRFAGNATGRIVEVGSGISPILPAGERVIYSDSAEAAMKFLKLQIGACVLVSSATDIALESASASTVVCSEVIEHIEDDRKALREMARVLKPGGELVLTVPAHPYYFSYDDRFVGHWRRYRIENLVQTLSGLGFNGFTIVKVAGPLEKVTMIIAVLAFRIVSPLVRPGKGSLLKLVLPLYKVANNLYSWLIKWEAKLVPLSLATIVLIHCRKQY